jgi:integrase
MVSPAWKRENFASWAMRAILPEDVAGPLSVIDNTRNRALVLILLRTGMKIGELPALRVRDTRKSLR